MTQYTTQMDAARQGIITPQMEIVAEKEHFDVEELRELIAKGQVIIPCNKNHKSISPSGVGAKLTTKINVNLGVSRDWKDVDMEYKKVHSANNHYENVHSRLKNKHVIEPTINKRPTRSTFLRYYITFSFYLSFIICIPFLRLKPYHICFIHHASDFLICP